MVLYTEGNTAAFEEILRRHENAVLNFVARFLGQRDVAEDVVQEVFIRVIKTADRYEKKAKFRTWLFTIARNLCIDRKRKQRRQPHVSLNQTLSSDDEQGETFLDRLVDDDTPDASSKSVRTEFRAKLQEALSELPDEQREVFTMREFSGMKFREIADVLGVSENTVKSRMRYALQTLRGHLADYRDFSFDREGARELS
ncbi:MAG: RNA polymerase sigma factor [Myxococcales bacterium]|nr:RNA polymerase sigma factor [Myxococcales bacterium]